MVVPLEIKEIINIDEIAPSGYAISKERERLIIDTLNKYDGNVARTAQEVGHSRKTVRKYGKKYLATLQRTGKGHPLTEEEKTKILELYHLHGNAHRVSTLVPQSHEAVQRVIHHAELIQQDHTEEEALSILRDAAKNCPSKSNDWVPNLPRESIDQIVAAYGVFDGVAKRVSHHLPYFEHAIKAVWRAKGLEVGRSGRKGLDSEEVRKAFYEYNGDAIKVARKFSRTPETILKYWRNDGLTGKFSSRQRKSWRLQKENGLELELHVDDILATYDELSPKIRERVRTIANERIPEKILVSFDAQYQYIAELIEMFLIPYQERKGIRLDAPIEEGEDGTIEKFIGKEDRNHPYYEEEPEYLLTPEELLARVNGSIDLRYKNVLNQLAHNVGILSFSFLPDDFLGDELSINRNLEELVAFTEKDGRYKVLQTRPIKSLKFNPLRIRFGNRHYHGNPLAFFRDHEAVYGGLSRAQLQKVDSGLYRSLLNHDQLDEAISATRKTRNREGIGEISERGNALLGVSEDEKTKILDCLKRNEGDITRTAEEVGYPSGVVRRYRWDYMSWARENGKPARVIEGRLESRNGFSSTHSQGVVVDEGDVRVHGCLEDTLKEGLSSIPLTEISHKSSHEETPAQEERYVPLQLWIYPSRRDLSDNTSITADEHQLMLCTFFRYRGDPYLAAEHVPFTPELLIKHWKGARYKLPKVEKREVPRDLEIAMVVNYAELP